MLFAHLKRIFNEAPEKTRASGLNYFRLNRRLGVTRRHEHLQLSIAIAAGELKPAQLDPWDLRQLKP
jgi:hypothetical protein